MAKKDEGEEAEKNMEVPKLKNKINLWMISTAVLALILIIMFVRAGITGSVIGALSKEQAGTKVTSLINGYFIQTGSATLDSVSEESGLYKVTLNYNSDKIPVYLTKDGKSLILPNGIVSVAEIEASANQQQTATENIPKSDKPSVELFVMSFCPYGVKAEGNILPIIELLKDKIDFKIKFIVSVNGNTINDVQSLHGINEAKEDARQVIIMKYYPDKFYSYLSEIDNNCYSLASDTAKFDECWKNAAQNLGMDINRIETAAYGTEGINLLKQDEADASKYEVSGSPTLIINGVQSSSIYSGTAATQQAICSAFNTAPSECSQEISVTGSATANQPSGSCS
jgi:thiol-disulfide isomerase/thioredoxin